MARRSIAKGLELDDDRDRIDVDVLDRHRGDGVGVEVVREAVDNGPYRDLRWWLATRDAHGLYARFGFAPPDGRFLTREGHW